MDKQLNIVFTGEVDCGKSTLIGRLLYDTGSVSNQAKKELQKTCRDLERGLEFAYLLDSFQEERQDEFTLDTTQAILKTKDREFLLIDVPGHQTLLRNMLSGASYADAAILVVDAKKILEEQTKRHLYILRFLGVDRLIVCINKMDLVSYDEKYFIEARRQIEEFLKEIGLYSNYIIPVSAKKGDNLLEESLKLDWHKGPALIRALDTFTRKEQIYNFRLPIQDIYEIEKENMVVGTIASGKINKGDLVRVSVSDIKLKVKAIKIFGKNRNTAESKESIGLVFNRLPEALERGCVLYKGISPKVTTQIRAKIFCLEPLEVNQELFISCATQKVRAKISQIKKSIDTATLEINKDINKLKPNEAAEVAITTQEPLIIERFQDLPELGRFIIEKDNEISAAGIML